VSERLLVEAINDCFHVELERDENVMVMGEDVGRAGGVFRATAGLRDRFGADRCVDTPLAEAGILGTAMGLCMAGWRPVCEMQYDAFSYPCLDQLITHVGRYRWRTGGAMEFPVTIRMPYGGGVRAPELHDDSPEAYYVHTPGVKVAIPSTPADAKGLLASAIREPDPVVILEPKLHYRTMRGDVPEGEYTVPLGEARLAREGTDVTLVAYGSMVPLCEQVADALAGEASVEVLDLRTLKPLDEDALLESAAKTGRVVIVQEAPRTAGFGAELAAILAEKAILDLRGPVIRVTGYDVPYPYWQIEDAYMPSVERVTDAVRKLLEFS
jgi:pyruvate dehydrogenase E1 component beta subunit